MKVLSKKIEYTKKVHKYVTPKKEQDVPALSFIFSEYAQMGVALLFLNH